MAIEESALYKRWIGFLFGLRVVIDQLGNRLPERAKLKIIGASAYDDPATSSTVLDFSTISPSQHGNLAGGALHAIATQSANGFMSAADKVIVDNLAATYVTAVNVTAPITKTGPALSPTIAISPATGDTAGSMSAADKAKLDGINPSAYMTIVNVTAPLTKTGPSASPTLAISAANETDAGTMSPTHYTKLSSIPAWNVDDAADSLVQRNPDGGIHAKHVRVWSAGPLGTSVPMPDGVLAPRYQLNTETNFTRSIPLNWSSCKVGGVESWSINDVSDIVNDVVDPFANLSIELDLPHGSKIRSIDIRSKGPGGGGNPLPANAPSFTLYRKNISTGTASVIGTLNDTLDGSYRGNVQTHTIDLTGAPHSVDASTYRYYLVITPEFGTDAIAGYLVRGCVANLTYPQTYDIAMR